MNVKFAVLSHVLPPAPLGQSVVLYKLLKNIPPEQYCLISREDPTDIPQRSWATQKLQSRYYRLAPTLYIPRPDRYGLYYLRTFVNTVIGILSRAWQTALIVRQEKIRTLIVCTGDLYDLPAAYLACLWTRIPYVVYLFDDYVYQWTGFKRWLAKRLETRVIRNAARLIAPNEFMAKEYLERYGTPSLLVHNPCEMPDLAALDSSPTIFETRSINIVYTGAIYGAHYSALRNMFKALELLNDPRIIFHIYTGQTPAELEREGLHLNHYVRYHDHVPQTMVPKILHDATILFLPLGFGTEIPEVIRTSAPGKTGEYLASSRPILVHAPRDSFISWYFRTNACGMVIDEDDPKLVSERLEQLLKDKELQKTLGQKGRLQAQKDFDEHAAQKTFYDLISTVQRE